MKKFVDSEKLNKLCKLARIYIKPEDTNKFLDLINGDLELLEALDKIDTSNLKELVTGNVGIDLGVQREGNRFLGHCGKGW